MQMNSRNIYVVILIGLNQCLNSEGEKVEVMVDSKDSGLDQYKHIPVIKLVSLTFNM